MAEKIINLAPHEQIIAVIPENASGPGWSNQPTWVHIVNYATNEYRCECIQPNERGAELHTLFASGLVICASLIAAVKAKKPRGSA